MTDRIAHWDRKYRTRGPTARRRLESLAPRTVLDAYEGALRRAFGDAAELILVREVRLGWSTNLATDDEGRLARKWGEAMAAAVLRAVADGEGTDSVVRYPDESAHLAAFVAAAAVGGPADAWHFARFARFTRPDPAETVRGALLAHADLGAAVFRRLAVTGDLGRVAGLLDGPTAARLWSAGPAARAPAAEALRPLFSAALALAARLGGPAVERACAEAWFAEFAAAAPQVDWRDRTALAQAVFAAARFVLDRSPPRRPPAPAEVAAAVAGLDWLDTEWLARQWDALAAGAPGRAPTPVPIPARPPARTGPTARQRQWLQALAAALPRLRAHLDRSDPASPRNRVLALALLGESRPEWSDDPAAAAFVELLLRAAAASRRGGAESAEAQAVRSLGESALALARELSVGAPDPLSTTDGPGIVTDAAGAFLLLRAVNDLRLDGLARRCGFPSGGADAPGRMAAALAARWAGLASPWDDAGLRWLGGVTSPDDEADGRAGWACGTEAAARFQQTLARALLGHRLLARPDRLHVAVVPWGDAGLLLLGGDDTTRVWPFAARLSSPLAAGPTLDRWVDDWRGLTGEAPTLVVPAGFGLPATGVATEVYEGPCREAASAFEALAAGSVGDSLADATLAAAAQAGLRAWARWLKGLGESTSPFLLAGLVRRPGRLFPDGDALLVELQPRPLDPALEVSGYLEPLELPPGSAVGAVRFRIGGPDG